MDFDFCDTVPGWQVKIERHTWRFWPRIRFRPRIGKEGQKQEKKQGKKGTFLGHDLTTKHRRAIGERTTVFRVDLGWGEDIENGDYAGFQPEWTDQQPEPWNQ